MIRSRIVTQKSNKNRPRISPLHLKPKKFYEQRSTLYLEDLTLPCFADDGILDSILHPVDTATGAVENAVDSQVQDVQNALSITSISRDIIDLYLSIFAGVYRFLGDVFSNVALIYTQFIPDILDIPGGIFEMLGDGFGEVGDIVDPGSGRSSRRKRSINGTSVTIFGEIENGVAVAVKFMFGRAFDLGKKFLTNPDSISSISANLLALWNEVKPLWDFARKNIIPEIMEAMLQVQKSNMVSVGTKEKIENVKEAYDLLALLGYMPKLSA